MQKISRVMLVLMLIAGAGFFMYPDVASWWNARLQTEHVREYYAAVEAMTEDEREAHLQRARDFNTEMEAIHIVDPFMYMNELSDDYIRTLNVNGVMARIEIPKIDVSLPVRHGTSHYVLDRGAGHLAGTSFPVGGESTHAVITAHSGLSGSRMFTHMLDGNITYGDYFFLTVMGERFAYRVVQLNIVLPHEIDLIQIYEGEDFVTLITCTPLAVNSHRLLVRGSRVPYDPDMVAAIVPIITVLQTSWRIFVAIGAFLVFIVVFSSYQLVRIMRGKQERRIQKLERTIIALHKNRDSSLPLDDPYLALPEDEDSEGYKEAQRLLEQAEARRKRKLAARRKTNATRRRVSISVAMILLVAGATVTMYPRVQFMITARNHEAEIEAWLERLDTYRENIVELWEEDSTGLLAAVQELPIASNGDIYVAPSGDIHVRSEAVELPSGEIMYVPSVLIASNGTEVSVGSGGELHVNGTTIAIGGTLTIGDLVVGDRGGLYISYNGNQISLHDLNVDEEGNILLGNMYIGDIAIAPLNTRRTSQRLRPGNNNNNAAGNGDNDTGTDDNNIGNNNASNNNNIGADEDYDEDDLPEYDMDLIFGFDPVHDDPFRWLTNVMNDYNRQLHESEQEELTCLESMEDVDFSVVDRARFTDEMIGFISIERMNVRIPIFSGASEINMLRGVAHLTQSSLPVGGINTNAVITGHRGMTGARMFRQLHLLQYGDIIEITNFYETLRYEVFETDVIYPHEFEQVLIREGLDMITLFTCEPYRINTHRLLVFARRVHD